MTSIKVPFFNLKAMNYKTKALLKNMFRTIHLYNELFSEGNAV